MWLDKVNAAGGINVGGKKMKVELVKYDYQSDGQRAAQLAEKLITDDKVDVLLSPFGSGTHQDRGHGCRALSDSGARLRRFV